MNYVALFRKYSELIEDMTERGYSESEINNEISRAEAYAEEQFYEDYYDDPVVQYGWHQQDIIDMYRRER